MADAEIEVDIVVANTAWRGMEELLGKALVAAAAAEGAGGGVSLLLGDDAAVAALNKEFRGKTGPTNVLAFPPAPVGEAGEGFLGDIALAVETVVAEAKSQGKRPEHHAAHLAVHGFLHLLGYNHENEADTDKMEARERAILLSVGINDPYA